jgi:hypothetical protein
MRRAALPPVLVLVPVLILALGAAGCGGKPPELSVWFVHATDPHLFNLPKPDEKPEQYRTRLYQQQLARRDFANLLAAAGSPAEAPARPAFLVLSGDLGLEALSKRAGVADADRTARIQQIADTLRTGPFKDIYYVLGNNDVCGEQARGTDADDAEIILGDLNRRLGGQVTLHDLTSCYLSAQPSSLDGCVADVGAGYRLIGFPSHSFKTAPSADECAEAARSAATGKTSASVPPGPPTRPAATAPASVPAATAPTSAPTAAAPASAPAATAPANAGTAATPASAPAAAPGNGPPVPEGREAQQKLQLATFLRLTARAAADGRKVLVVTHVAELDDPYNQAQGLFAGVPPTKSRPDWAPWSSWDVSPEIRRAWQQQVDSDLVAGVLAGHFHDSHREVYYPPYAWSAAGGGRARKDKVWLAPPLSIKLQDASPYQARGFVLVRLDPDRSWRRYYWYDGHASFVPDPVAPAASRRRPPGGGGAGFGSWLGAGWRWLWGVGADPSGSLARAAVAAIALLLAFLTVVQVWQIPPPDTKTATPAVAAQAAAGAGGAAPASPPGGAGPGAAGASSGSKLAPFDSNLANTVLAGLLGMFGVQALSPLFGGAGQGGASQAGAGFDPKLYYLLLFVVFFLSLLLLSAVLLSAVEALRSRILMPAPACDPPGPVPQAGGTDRGPGEDAVAGRARRRAARATFWRWLHSFRILHRFWRWVLSLRTPLLVFADTFYHVIQGKNQLQTAIFDSSIRDLQLTLALACDQVARSVHRAVIHALECAAGDAGERPRGEHVRVNVSVLSDDRQSVYYVSWEPGSSSLSFPMHSVAWVAVRAGQARWWKKSYTDATPPAKPPDIVLYSDDPLPPLQPAGEQPPPLKLADYFQKRGPIDYEAFVVLPIPWRRRDGGASRLAGLHISFQTEKLMDALWQGLDGGTPATKAQQTAGASSASTPAADASSTAPAAGASPTTPAAAAGASSKPSQGDGTPSNPPAPPYTKWSDLLSRSATRCCKPDDNASAGGLAIKDEALQQSLEQALAVLAEVLRPFNETIFLDYVQKRKGATL